MSQESSHQGHIRRLTTIIALGVAFDTAAAWAECPIPATRFKPDPEFTSKFLIEHCRFKDEGRTPFFVLKEGYQIVLESDEEVQVITVLDKTKWVAGVKTRVVEEFEYEKDGDELIPVERSLNYFAICRPTNSVFYFGEDVEDFDEDGNVISHGGAWLAGRHGARAGIIMPGTILVGGGYYEEIAPEDSALDKARIVSIKKGCEAGEFEFRQHCLRTENSSDCSADEEDKLYVAGVGIVKDEDLEITSYGYVDDDDDEEEEDD